jgi:predicted methyltransferase
MALDRMVAQQEIPWPQLADGKAEDGEIPKLYRVQGTPAFYILGGDGLVSAKLGSVQEVEKRLPEVVSASANGGASSRDIWRRPSQVMDLLGMRSGSSVADVGSGEGYFTFKIADRVGPKGKVYAVDIDTKAIAQVRERAANKSLVQVEGIVSQPDDPMLPACSVDSALVVNAYHEFHKIDAMLNGIYNSLKQGGRFGILDSSAPLGQPRSAYEKEHHIPGELIVEDAVRHHLRLDSFDSRFIQSPDGRLIYFVILEKQDPCKEPGKSPQ